MEGINNVPKDILTPQKLLKTACIETPLGSMVVISDEKALHLLEFSERRGLEYEIERLCLKTNTVMVSGTADPIISIESELKSYFEGSLKAFKTPLHLLGSSFQKRVWLGLMTIPYGETRSYAEQAIEVGNQAAYRAVANANGANQIAIVIPCHRIIRKNGDLGGYAGGIARKKWLIAHEKCRLSESVKSR